MYETDRHPSGIFKGTLTSCPKSLNRIETCNVQEQRYFFQEKDYAFRRRRDGQGTTFGTQR